MIDAERHVTSEFAAGRSDALLAQVVETGADAIMVVASDGRMTFLNSAAEQLLGIDRDQLTGHPYTDLSLLTLDGAAMPVEDRPTARVLEAGEAVYEAESLYERPDGERIVLSANASPLTGPDGEITGVIVSVRDATARKAAEQALRRQAATLRAQANLLELAHDAIFVRDLSSGVIVYWNRGAEEMYGYRRDEAIGRVSHDLLQTQFPQPLTDIEDTMVRDGQWNGELIQRTRDGTQVYILSRWALQRDAEGEPIAFLEINRDVTPRRQAELDLARRAEDLARANGEIDRGQRELAAMNAGMTSISQSLDLPQVLQNIVNSAREIVQARYAALGVSDSRGRITEFITSGITSEQRAAIGPLPQGHGLLGTLIKDGTPLRARNIAEDPRSHGFPPNHPPMTSLLGVPIVSQGRPVGDLYVTDKLGADEFGEDDQNLLTVFAGHAAVAIEKAQLYEDVRAARDQLRDWNRRLEAKVAERTWEIERISREITTRVLKAQENERERIARELHDETSQSLSRLLIDLDLIKPYLPQHGLVSTGVDRLEQGLRRTLDEVRALSHDLRPAILQDFGLVAAIQTYADDWLQTFNLPIRVDVEAATDDRLPSDVEIAVFRVAQEALMNAGKYARARQIHVRLSITKEEVQLLVRDDGAGFDVETLDGPTRQGGLGLHGMRERAALLGGSLTIDTAPGHGTEITLVAPVQ